MIRVKNVSKKLKDKFVLQDINLEFEEVKIRKTILADEDIIY